MRESYLEITFRHGLPLAAYYYLPRRARDRSHRTQCFAAGILVDFSRDGRPIGIEITAPTKVTLGAMNRVLRAIGLEPLKRVELAPLLAA